ncbi:MAG: peptide chain release factor N(5)-glutamine methyltransferase [Acidimicrobiales bacterium]
MTVALDELVREATTRLQQAGVRDPEVQARAIASAALGDVPGFEGSEAMLTAQFVELVRRRSARVSLERLLGSVRFREIEIAVGRGVFVPQPETEPVVEWCVREIGHQAISSPRVIDLCTGSGVVALSLAHELRDAEVHAVEIDPTAHAWAKQNADRRAAAGDRPIVLHLADITALPHALDGTFDLVVSNPPYVADHEIDAVDPEVRDHDPRRALEGGADGLDLVRAVERVASRLVKEGGLVVVEHSDRQGHSAPAVFAATGQWVEIQDNRDQEGLDRFLTARRHHGPGLDSQETAGARRHRSVTRSRPRPSSRKASEP